MWRRARNLCTLDAPVMNPLVSTPVGGAPFSLRGKRENRAQAQRRTALGTEVDRSVSSRRGRLDINEDSATATERRIGR